MTRGCSISTVRKHKRATVKGGPFVLCLVSHVRYCPVINQRTGRDIKVAKRSNPVISTISLDTPAKLMKRQVFKKLSKNGFSGIHRSFQFAQF